MSYTHRSSTQARFPGARHALEQGRLDQMEKLEGIARDAASASRRFQKAMKKAQEEISKNGLVQEQTQDEVEDAMYYLSSTGSVVNSWAEEDN